MEGFLMKKVLLTGFDPFGGEAINPAIESVRKLEGEVIEDHEVVALEVSTVFDKSIQELKNAIDEVKPGLVICVGQAGGRAHISVERIAINVNDARIPDNAGNQPVDTPVIEAGPAAYWSTLPIKAMVEALKNKGIPAMVSQTAGTFVCNHIFYGLMHELHTKQTLVRGGFIHIPFLPEQAAKKPEQPSMALDIIAEGLQIAVETAVRNREDIKTAGGQIS
jgi:pyroglutamyl-peptidase